MNKKRIAIIDYQMGNLFSVKHACVHVGLDPIITSDKKVILDADAVILPGVGAFGQAMSNLQEMGLVDIIHDYITKGRPFMGICLGLQLLFSESEEFGVCKGLDIIKGRVVRFPNIKSSGNICKVPQIGWNTISHPNNSKWEDTPLSLISSDAFMYFVHSYYVVPINHNDVLSVTTYEDVKYCSAILHENVFATQYHPEKSGIEGIKIYKKWADYI